MIAGLLGVAPAPTTWAQGYPSKPIRIIAPSSTGGPLDIMSRGMAVPLSQSMGQPVIVENRAGANGIVGTNVVAKTDPDGYTMLMATASHTANPSMVKDLPYDTINDFTPITEFARHLGQVLLSGPGFPARTVAELVALARTRSAPLTYATSGYGNPTHISGALFGKLAAIPMQDVQYKGSNASNLQDLMTGRVDLAFISLSVAAALIQSGKLRAFALTGPRRSPLASEVPTFPELGYKEMNLPGVYGLYFPAKVPRDRVQRMYQEVLKAIKGPVLAKLFDETGMYPTGTSPEEFAAYVKEDVQRQARLVADLGLKPQ